MKTYGFQWMMSNQKEDDILKVRSKIYILSSEAKRTGQNLKQLAKKMVQKSHKNDYEDFDEFKFLKSSVYELAENEDTRFIICSCPVLAWPSN